MDVEYATEALTRWKPLLLKICAEYGYHYPWLHDDFVSDGFLSLWKDFAKPTRAAVDLRGGLVAMIVKRAIWLRLKLERAKCRWAFPANDRASEDKHAGTLDLVPARDPGEVARIDIEDSLNVLLKNLRSDVLDRLNGATFTEIAHKRGSSHQAVQQRVGRAIERLAKSLLS